MLVQFSCTQSAFSYFALLCTFAESDFHVFWIVIYIFFRSRMCFEFSWAIFMLPFDKLKRGNGQKANVEIRPQRWNRAHTKCKLIKSYNSYWHKSSNSRYDGAQVLWETERNCFPAHGTWWTERKKPLQTPYKLHLCMSCKSVNYAIELCAYLPSFYWQAWWLAQ